MELPEIIVIIITSSLSVISVLIVIFFFFLFKNLRTAKFELSTYMSIGALIASLSYMLYYQKSLNGDIIRCKTQAFLMVFGETSEFLWSALIGYHVKTIISNIKNANNPLSALQRGIFLCIGFVIPLIISIIGLIVGQLGTSGYWCWAKNLERGHHYYHYTILGFNYASFFINLWFSVQVILYFTRSAKNENEKIEYKKIAIRMLKFPIIQIGCIIIPSVYRLLYRLTIFSEVKNVLSFRIFSFLSIISMSLVGLLLSIAYTFSTEVYPQIKSMFKKNLSKKEPSLICSDTGIDTHCIVNNQEDEYYDHENSFSSDI